MRTIAFDLSRTLIGAASDTPRGIDRVDMGYARHFFAEGGGGNIGLLPSAHRMGVLDGARSDQLTSLVERHWRESRPASDDALHHWLQRRIAGEHPPRPAPPAAARTGIGAARLYGALAQAAKGALVRPAIARVPQGAVYVNIGQVLLGWGWFFDWLDKRPDVRPVFMLHDLIPVLHPEYTGPLLSRHHQRAVQTAARRAAAMVATSHASADEIRDALKRLGRLDMPIHVTPLPVGAAFLEQTAAASRADFPPYFVSVGAIDQRKNHLLLLHVWREMASRGKGPVPKLVIVGVRGQRSTQALELMNDRPDLAENVIEVNGLSTPAMRELIRGARALLMPSFTEGFGLPVTEALALGAPVIASDIRAHREVGGSFCCYLDPLDGLGWLHEIEARAGESADQFEARRRDLHGRRTQTWASYFEQVSPFLADL